MPESIHVRRARPDDLALLAGLAESTFRAAFGADNDLQQMEAYVREAFAPARMRAELDEAGNVFLLALEAAGAALGYARLRRGPAADSVSGPDPVEIERIYVRAEAIGIGVGTALMRALLDDAVAAGYRTAWLGVWERNERALRFYQRRGFAIVGAHVFHFGSERQTDVIMECPLAVAGETSAG